MDSLVWLTTSASKQQTVSDRHAATQAWMREACKPVILIQKRRESGQATLNSFIIHENQRKRQPGRELLGPEAGGFKAETGDDGVSLHPVWARESFDRAVRVIDGESCGKWFEHPGKLCAVSEPHLHFASRTERRSLSERTSIRIPAHSREAALLGVRLPHSIENRIATTHPDFAQNYPAIVNPELELTTMPPCTSGQSNNLAPTNISR